MAAPRTEMFPAVSPGKKSVMSTSLRSRFSYKSISRSKCISMVPCASKRSIRESLVESVMFGKKINGLDGSGTSPRGRLRRSPSSTRKQADQRQEPDSSQGKTTGKPNEETREQTQRQQAITGAEDDSTNDQHDARNSSKDSSQGCRENNECKIERPADAPDIPVALHGRDGGGEDIRRRLRTARRSNQDDLITQIVETLGRRGTVAVLLRGKK